MICLALVGNDSVGGYYRKTQHARKPKTSGTGWGVTRASDPERLTAKKNVKTDPPLYRCIGREKVLNKEYNICSTNKRGGVSLAVREGIRHFRMVGQVQLCSHRFAEPGTNPVMSNAKLT